MVSQTYFILSKIGENSPCPSVQPSELQNTTFSYHSSLNVRKVNLKLLDHWQNSTVFELLKNLAKGSRHLGP